MEFIFAFIIIVLILFEYKLYKTFINPFTIIALIYCILIPFNNFIGADLLQFDKVNDNSIFYILYFLIIIFIVSLIFYPLINDNRFTKQLQNNYGNYEKMIVVNKRKFILCLFIIGFIAKYISLLQCIQAYGINNIKGKSSGIFAHIGGLSVILLPYILLIYVNNKRKVYYLIMILLVFLNLLMFGGKYGIIIAFAHMIIFYAMMRNINIKKTLKYGLLMAGIAIFIFIGIYAIKPIIINGYFSKDEFLISMEFSIRHFFSYLLGPLVASNYYFNNFSREGIIILFTVLINIVKALIGSKDYINPVNKNFVSIAYNKVTNVGGLFSECVYNSGFLISTIYIAFFFSLVYYFYLNARYKGKKISICAYMLSVVLMMFFSNFLTVSGVVLNLIYLYIIEIVLSKKIILRK